MMKTNIITSFFFPSDETFLTVLCYLIILVAALRRFSKLAEGYKTYNAPENARPWTTWLRYYVAASLYLALVAAIFAAFYNLVLEYPKLIDVALQTEVFSGLSDLLEKAKDQPFLPPLFSVILVTWGVNKIKVVSSWDRTVRKRFQLLGAIPIRVSFTINMLERTKFEKFDAEQCLKSHESGLGEARKEILSAARQKDGNPLASLYLRAMHLNDKVAAWDGKGSRFYDFRTIYDRQFDYLRSAFKTANRAALRYYTAVSNFCPSNPLAGEDAHGDTNARQPPSVPRLLKELRRDAKEELKEFLDSLYTFVACAVHSEGFTERSRRKYLSELGFQFEDRGRQEPWIDVNDLFVLALFVAFVVPVAAAFARLLGPGLLPNKGYEICIVWPLMAMVAGLSSVVFALFVKQAKEHSESRLWRCLRPEQGRPWCAYGVAGVLSAGTCAVGLVLLSYLLPECRDMGVAGVAHKHSPWALVSAGIAFATAFHLDSTALHPDVEESQKRSRMVVESLSTALASTVGATFALFISQDDFSLRAVGEGGLKFAIPAAALLGGAAGAIVPARYRRHLAGKGSLHRAETDLTELAEQCVADISGWAEREGISVVTRPGADQLAVEVDRNLFEHAVRGLLSNAVEFTQAGGQVVVEVDRTNSGRALLRVRDNGIGMCKETVTAVSKPLSSTESAVLEAALAREVPNLKQIRSIVERHGGTLTIHSTAYEGTDAVVELPEKLSIARQQGEAWGQLETAELATMPH